MNELDTRDKVTQAIFKNCKPLLVEQEVSTFSTDDNINSTSLTILLRFYRSDGQMKTVVGPVVAHLIMTDEAVKLFPNLQFYQAKGFLHGFLGVEEVAEVHALVPGLRVGRRGMAHSPSPCVRFPDRAWSSRATP